MREQERWSVERYLKEMGLAKGVVVPQDPKVRKSILELTKPERAYAHFLEFEKLAGRIVAYWPQPFALRLPGWRQTYRPDFLVEHTNESLQGAGLEIVEIKTLWRNGKVGWEPDAREKFKTAAGLLTCFGWVVRWWDDDRWREEWF